VAGRCWKRDGWIRLEVWICQQRFCVGRRFAQRKICGGREYGQGPRLMKYLVTLLGMLVLPVLGQTNLTVRLQNPGKPVVGFRVPDKETSDLTIVNSTNVLLKSANQKFQTLVGCQNMIDVSWFAATNKVYHVLIRTNLSDPWTYSRVRVVGAGSVYHFYDFSDAPRRLYALSIE